MYTDPLSCTRYRAYFNIMKLLSAIKSAESNQNVLCKRNNEAQKGNRVGLLVLVLFNIENLLCCAQLINAERLISNVFFVLYYMVRGTYNCIVVSCPMHEYH